ncbi:MAG: Nif3-like dinuclear metal center hexameric protein, partial [Eggerthella lenta]
MVAAKKNQKDSKGREGLARRASGLLSKPVTAVTTGALERALLAEFPAADAEPWDRTGMSVGDPARLITGVAVALDPTVEAIEAAANMGANVLVTHHPAFLAPPASFMPASSVAANPGAGVWRAVERGVSILSYHTALDVSVRAQRVLPGMLSLTFQQVLDPIP